MHAWTLRTDLRPGDIGAGLGARLVAETIDFAGASSYREIILWSALIDKIFHNGLKIMLCVFTYHSHYLHTV